MNVHDLFRKFYIPSCSGLLVMIMEIKPNKYTLHNNVCIVITNVPMC